MTTLPIGTPKTSRPRVAARTADLTAAVDSLATAERHLRQPTTALSSTPDSEAWAERYRSLVEALPDACFFTDTAGVIREANHAASGLLGFARKYCLGKPLATYILPEHAGRFRETLAQAATLGAGKVLTWQGQVKPRGMNRPAQVALRISAIRDGDGVLAGLCWLVRDVTAEEERDAALRTLQRGEDARLRTQTAELTATVRVQSALLAQERAAREQAEGLVQAYQGSVERVAADVGAFLRAVGADETAITQVVSRLTREIVPATGGAPRTQGPSCHAVDR